MESEVLGKLKKKRRYDNNQWNGASLLILFLKQIKGCEKIESSEDCESFLFWRKSRTIDFSQNRCVCMCACVCGSYTSFYKVTKRAHQFLAKKIKLLTLAIVINCIVFYFRLVYHIIV